MIMHFEDLCNELLLDIFDYINPRHLYFTFGNLNSRLNNLFASVKHLQLIVDGEENNEIITSLAHHIARLKVNTWDEIDLNGFCNLYSLILTRPSPIQLKQIRADTMPKLIYLSLFSNVFFSSPQQLICDAFSNRFSYLLWARLGHIDSAFDPLQWSQSISLRYLHIGCCHTTMIPFVLLSCPRLERLHVDILRRGEKLILSPPIIDNHPLRQFILRDYCRSVLYNDINTLLTYIPNTRKIELKFNCNTPFISLARRLSDCLSHLRKFDCDITEFPIDSTTNLTAIQQIHPCFCHIACRTQGIDFRILVTQ
jgi:hypothetical protein